MKSLLYHMFISGKYWEEKKAERAVHRLERQRLERRYAEKLKEEERQSPTVVYRDRPPRQRSVAWDVFLGLFAFFIGLPILLFFLIFFLAILGS